MKKWKFKIGEKTVELNVLWLVGGVAAIAAIIVAICLLAGGGDEPVVSVGDGSDVESVVSNEISAETTEGSESSELSDASEETEESVSSESEDVSEEGSAAESSESSEVVNESSEESESVAPETTESEVQPPETTESEVQPPETTESEVQPPETTESEVQPPETTESGVEPPETTESEVQPPEESSEESSEEESSVIITDPTLPMNPLPDTLATDPVDSYFNNSVFVGYSIMMHFGRYIGEWHSEIDSSIMGNPVFCAGVGISFYIDRTQSSTDRNTSLPTYRGKAYNFKDLPAATGCNNMYIGLMGYSDVKRLGLMSAYVETVNGIKRIKDANPNLNLVILACTYNTGNYSGSMPSSLNNGALRTYNNMVLEYCNQNGVDFVDVATPLTTYEGYLPEDYSSDAAYHIAKKAFYIWVDVLRDYAKAKQNGTWKNATEMPVLPAFE